MPKNNKPKLPTHAHLQHIPQEMWDQMTALGLTGGVGVKGPTTPFINEAIKHALTRIKRRQQARQSVTQKLREHWREAE